MQSTDRARACRASNHSEIRHHLSRYLSALRNDLAVSSARNGFSSRPQHLHATFCPNLTDAPRVFC